MIRPEIPHIVCRKLVRLRSLFNSVIEYVKASRWALGVLAGLAVVVVTFIPQLGMCVNRGPDWQGWYATTDVDELVYSAYLNALIHDKPRRNDPFLATRGSPEANQETYFSIQFLPPYIIALTARTLGLSAATAFILLTPLMAFASSLAIFWLLFEVTGDKKTSAIGVIVILLCGVLVSANPLTTENTYAVFSFLRRYIPAIPFPLFFLFCICIWRAFTQQGRRPLWWAAAAGVIFILLVYSYFFLWTAAGAWIFCFAGLWLIARPSDRMHVLKCLALCSSIMVVGLIPYFRLLMQRATTIDRDQALLLTHAPDLFRLTEGLGIVILLALVWGFRRRRIDWKKPAPLFAASCAVVPLLVFNQQIVTGHSLQPFHYEQFIVNYLILVGLVITDQLLLKLLLKRPIFSIALALVVGISLALKITTEYSHENVLIDEAIPLFKKLEEDATRNPGHGFAVFDRTILSASAPTTCLSVPLLWSHYMYTYGSISTAEDNERLFQYFYYMGVDEVKVEKLLTAPMFRAALFGLPRINSTLTKEFKPVTQEEIKSQVAEYSKYKRDFSRERAERWPLSYVILPNERAYDLSNLDRWYERDKGERVGSSLLYRVHLRPLN